MTLMTIEDLDKVLNTVKSSKEFRGQLISTEFNVSSKMTSIDLLDIKQNDKVYGELLVSFFSRQSIKDLCKIELNIIKRILLGKDIFIVTVNNPQIKHAIDCAHIIRSFYLGKKIIYISLENYQYIIERLKIEFNNLLEYHHLNISQSCEVYDNDFLIIHPSQLLDIVNSDKQKAYPLSLLYDNYVIDNIHLYDSRELNHLSEVIKEIKKIREYYDLDSKEINITLTSTPIENRKEIASLFFNTIDDDTVINYDDTKGNKFSTYFWKPSLETESKIEKIDQIHIKKDNLHNETRKLISSFFKSRINLKILFWINEIGLSNDFKLNLLNNIEDDKYRYDGNIEINTSYRLENLELSDYYSYDIIIVINPTRISGFLLEQCSKLVKGENSMVVLFLGEDHLSQQLLRSQRFSLDWNEEPFNLPRYFVLDSLKIKEYYNKVFKKILNQFCDLYKKN